MLNFVLSKNVATEKDNLSNDQKNGQILIKSQKKTQYYNILFIFTCKI